jgi:glycosyltransferase involved in cell wall biosynthesis
MWAGLQPGIKHVSMTRSPLRILQLTPRLPYPPTDGGRVVMLQIARALQRQGCEVQVLSLNPRKQRGDVEAARRALAPVTLDAVDVDTSARGAVLLRSFKWGVPQFVARFVSPRFAARLRERLRAADFDVVQVESPFLLPYVSVIREMSRAAVVLRSLNVEFRIWEQLALHEPRALRRAALRVITRSIRRYEIANLDACDAVVPITEGDARELRALGCTRPMYVLPGGVDIAELADPSAAPAHAHSAGFLGSLDYRPNQEAALWIAEELRPRLARVAPAADIVIGGSNAPEWLRARLAASGVTLAGEVPDAAAFIDSMGVMIAPLLSGGGMRIKILEAMARGKAVVATTLGAEGIDVRSGESIVLAEGADAFAAAVARLGDPLEAASIGAAARRLVESRYATGVLAQGLAAFYEELAQRRRVDAGR